MAKILALKVTKNGSASPGCYVAATKEGLSFLTEDILAAPEIGEIYYIEVIECEEEWLDNLPEWDGY